MSTEPLEQPENGSHSDPKSESPSSKSIHTFLDKPPLWFALIFWFYPLIFSIAVAVILKCAGAVPDLPLRTTLISFTLPLVILMFSSRWLRQRILFMVPCWLILLTTVMGQTQGALSSAISKAFDSGAGHSSDR